MTKGQTGSQQAVISKQAFARAQLGQSFAEHDLIRQNSKLFVETPAIRAAHDLNGGKTFFVGRRGTGKTAITYYLKNRYPKNTVLLIPKLLSSADAFVSFGWDERIKQKPFNTLVSGFVRAILDEVVLEWKKQGLFTFRAADGSEITRERNVIENYEFDLRLLYLIEEGFSFLQPDNPKEWLKFRNRPAKLAEEITNEYANQARMRQIILIDRLDDEWDESNKAVTLVMALMHACNEIRAITPAVRPMVFLRENVFDRVRELDSEFSRLETSLVSLDWTRELLRELIERRLNEGLITKFALDGSTWRAFFEGQDSQSQERVFNYCQYRPRDILLYTSTALGIAQSHQRSRIEIADLDESQKSFSESRLKELADEYADNYPRLNVILSRFHGLGTEYTIGSVEDFIKKLLVDEEVKSDCGIWVYQFTSPELFIQLLYNVGFWGVREANGKIRFKSSEAENPGSLILTNDSTVVVHPSYADGLQLQNSVITALGDDVSLRTSGLISDVPASFSTITYRSKLEELSAELATLPTGKGTAKQFEEVIGDVIRLCFFRSLHNVEAKVRTIDGTVIRDWIASNRAAAGFWAIIRDKYSATQVIWECKNYADLKADDFHQCLYYMTEQTGRFMIMVCRSQEPLPQHFFNHVKRVFASSNGVVLILRESDIKTFLRQALNGKRSEQHLQDLFDNTERIIS
ncbi:MAG TPA: hypothetical protein VNE63_18390 [Candidatus Acidoferrales bacterium]|nr:hypothetical protein [Candidatus Acidoferrales bacterium]